MRVIRFEHDDYPDFSWLEQDHYNPRHPSYDPVYHSRADMKAGRNPIDGDWYRNPANHVALSMVVFDDSTGDIIDSLGGIDFLEESDDWGTGLFHYVSDIPKQWRYLRSLARDAGLRYRPRMKGRAA